MRDYAFYYQTSLQKVILNDAQSIGSYAFANSGLKELTINTRNICTLFNTNAFQNTSLEKIYVPSQLVNSYKSATNWYDYRNIIQAIS